MMKNLKINLWDLDITNKKLAVISHVNPDADSLGSIMALGLALQKNCQSITICVCDHIPNALSFLPFINTATNYHLTESTQYDICFVLDCADEKRLGESQGILDKSHQIINIDHHVSNGFFGDINSVNPHASSTSEIIYELLIDNNITITPDIATCLYAGIVGDTGNFLYDNTSAQTHYIAGRLKEYDAQSQLVSYHLYQNKSLGSAKFQGYVLSQFESLCGGKVAIFSITLELLQKFNVSIDDIDYVSSIIRDIEGIEVAVVLKEVDSEVTKVSFRSKCDFDVNQLAQKFGGGGHIKASGATIFHEIEQAKKMVQKQLEIEIRR
ncbi:phosphoesterase, RecJ domain protein [Alkaliphilus metalliredigens QYMF]|uniref:Phosphoesterase, RecJ domain protein n=1 Tax=Alkaliphilus metalliredigens (strain QYMF) TaxID=293826 RepID=A6TRK5_ALKMQ|nr:phosphoesterase, RecJ domain protein [Alkaliphilus metalliredigens QYMF]